MKLASLLYLPGLTVSPERTGACLANLARWKHAYPIFVYSDSEWHSSLWKLLGAAGPMEFFKCGNPEVVKTDTVHHVPKLAYLMGLEIAIAQGLTHFLTLETDCRVWGDNWDEAIFTEFLEQGDDKVLGGTLFVWHPFNAGLDYAQEFTAFMQVANLGFQKRLVSLPNVFVYGGRGSCEKHKTCAYPNGAGSIAKTSFVQQVFGHREIKVAAQEGSAWDAHLGFGLFDIYGPNGYTRLAPLRNVFSVYGDLLTSEQLRLNLLTLGQVRLAHQVKSAWSGV